MRNEHRAVVRLQLFNKVVNQFRPLLASQGFCFVLLLLARNLVKQERYKMDQQNHTQQREIEYTNSTKCFLIPFHKSASFFCVSFLLLFSLLVQYRSRPRVMRVGVYAWCVRVRVGCVLQGLLISFVIFCLACHCLRQRCDFVTVSLGFCVSSLKLLLNGMMMA